MSAADVWVVSGDGNASKGDQGKEGCGGSGHRRQMSDPPSSEQLPFALTLMILRCPDSFDTLWSLAGEGGQREKYGHSFQVSKGKTWLERPTPRALADGLSLVKKGGIPDNQQFLPLRHDTLCHPHHLLGHCGCRGSRCKPIVRYSLNIIEYCWIL